jgi:hypothetical protein
LLHVDQGTDALPSFLSPSYGWGLLSITHQAMALLLSQLSVFSSIFKYLSAFGTKSFAQDEGYTGFDNQISLDSSGNMQSIGMRNPPLTTDLRLVLNKG